MNNDRAVPKTAERALESPHRIRPSVLTCAWILLAVFAACLPASAVSAEEIASKAAVVMDAGSGRVLYAKNPELQLMPASTTKLMTALVVVEKKDLRDVTTVSSRAAGVAPTRSGLRAGDRVTIETLLYAALMKSANDAAVALAEAVAGSEEEFVVMMNRKAAAIGANDTRFVNPHGLPGSGQHTTAYDLAKIMRQAIRHQVLKEILGTKITEVSTQNGKTVFLKNTNKLLWSDEEVLGGKTGFTYQARHCFVCAGERDSETLIVALLGAPSRDTLWRETEQLLGFGSKVMANVEEPVVYLTRADYESGRMVKASYTRKAAGRKGRLVKAKTDGTGKTAAVKTAKKGIKKTAKKPAAKRPAKKTKKSTRVLVSAPGPKGSGAVGKGANGLQG
ncbi:MAG: hypothetical protein OHK006_03040 [Thermodesulfovibrionales bacterium]